MKEMTLNLHSQYPQYLPIFHTGATTINNTHTLLPCRLFLFDKKVCPSFEIWCTTVWQHNIFLHMDETPLPTLEHNNFISMRVVAWGSQWGEKRHYMLLGREHIALENKLELMTQHWKSPSLFWCQFSCCWLEDKVSRPQARDQETRTDPWALQTKLGSPHPCHGWRETVWQVTNQCQLSSWGEEEGRMMIRIRVLLWVSKKVSSCDEGKHVKISSSSLLLLLLYLSSTQCWPSWGPKDINLKEMNVS